MSLDGPTLPARFDLPTSDSGQYYRLTGRWGRLGRIVWVISGLLMVGFTLAGAVPRFWQAAAFAEPFAGPLLANTGLTPQFYGAYFVIIAALLLVIYGVPAVVLFVRRSDDWMALLTSSALIALATASTDWPDALLELYPNLYLPVDLIRAASQALPHIALFVFPTGRAVPPWTRWLALLRLVLMLAQPFLYHTALHPRAWPLTVYLLWTVFWLGLGIWAQVYRYRDHASQAQRQQTKWFVYGAAIGAGVYVLLVLALIAWPAARTVGTLDYVAWRPIEYTLYMLSLVPLPLGLTVAIMRYRLWDIDFIINRSLVYGPLMVLLVVILGTVLFIVTTLFQNIAGGTQSMIVLMLSAMLFGAAFGPARRRLQRFVDVRLYGIRVDYERAKPLSPGSRPAAPGESITLAAYGELELVGRGGMSDVYRGLHPTLGQPVAIKMLASRLTEDADALARFEREARLAMRLSHPNIVSVYDYGRTGDSRYIVMEYIQGPTLADWLEREGQLSLAQMAPLLEQIGAALDYAHEAGLVHRDIKPSNVMIDTQNSAGSAPYRAVLMDFGIARLIESSTRLTRSGLVGTFEYMAPEQIRGDLVDRRLDVYALGILTYQALTGRTPFRANNPGAILIAHLQQPVPNPRASVPTLPEDAAQALMRALAKGPDERFASAGEFTRTLVETVA